jgi:hypothetical protein
MTSGAFFSILVACSLLPFFAGFAVFMSISLIFELATARSGPRMKSPLYDAFKKAASQRPSCHPLKLNSDRIARPPTRRMHQGGRFQTAKLLAEPHQRSLLFELLRAEFALLR